jgi:hypothetical protein
MKITYVAEAEPTLKMSRTLTPSPTNEPQVPTKSIDAPPCHESDPILKEVILGHCSFVAGTINAAAPFAHVPRSVATSQARVDGHHPHLGRSDDTHTSHGDELQSTATGISFSESESRATLCDEAHNRSQNMPSRNKRTIHGVIDGSG